MDFESCNFTFPNYSYAEYASEIDAPITMREESQGSVFHGIVDCISHGSEASLAGAQSLRPAFIQHYSSTY